VAPPPGRRKAGKPEPRPAQADETPEVETDETPEVEVDETPAVEADEELADGEAGRSAATDAFWTGVRVEPIEIALPGGVGYTLRAYRMDNEVTPTDISGREDEVALPARTGPYDVALDDEDADLDEDDDLDGFDGDAEEPELDEDEDAAKAAEEPEEVPVFLSHGGHLLVFRSAEGLVAFVRSDAQHDLAQIDTWADLTEGITARQVVPLPDDEYELDLVVNNLRGGHDVWDPELLLQAGQLARDLGHALHIEPVVHALAAGSPLDNLDEVLRAVATGGFGAFMARRKAKKIGAETASLGWRSVIGKISSVVDWRD
jgi:hypothetical protein